MSLSILLSTFFQSLVSSLPIYAPLSSSSQTLRGNVVLWCLSRLECMTSTLNGAPREVHPFFATSTTKVPGPPPRKTPGQLRRGLSRDHATKPAKHTYIISKPGLLSSLCYQNGGEINSGESRLILWSWKRYLYATNGRLAQVRAYIWSIKDEMFHSLWKTSRFAWSAQWAWPNVIASMLDDTT